MTRIRTLAGLSLCSVLAASGVAADPSGGTSLAAPGACAQPDPELTTPTVQGMPPGVAGRPTDAFTPADLTRELDDLTAGLLASRSTTTTTSQSPLGALVDGVLRTVGLAPSAADAPDAESSTLDGLTSSVGGLTSTVGETTSSALGGASSSVGDATDAVSSFGGPTSTPADPTSVLVDVTSKTLGGDLGL